MIGETHIEFYVKELVKFAEKSGDFARRCIELLGVALHAEAVKRAPINTGNLRVKTLPPVWEGRDRLVIYTGAGYWRMVHFGTKPHVIRPRQAKALRFEIDGNVIFAKSVTHKGTKPRPYFSEAIRVLDAGKIKSIINQALEEAIEVAKS